MVNQIARLKNLTQNNSLKSIRIFSLALIFTIGSLSHSLAQGSGYIYADSSNNKEILLLNESIQIEITEAVNNMYNFKFQDAEREFRWLKYRYPNHPLPDFLLGLSEWWKIMPNIENEQYDNRFLMYMDSTIYKAEKMMDVNEEDREASFFLAGAYGFKGRLYSERKSWRKATVAGSSALKYLNLSRDENADFFNPELMFGDALYNYYSVWIPENYPLLKPILVFFRKGDKQLGIDQLREVSRNSFYSRTEAQYFLMRILYTEEKDIEGGYQIAEYLYDTYPDNAYFHRYFTMLNYLRGRTAETEKLSLRILENLDAGMPGYEAISGRYASFFLGHINETRNNKVKAMEYYSRAISFGEESESQESGYYIYSLLNLGKIQAGLGNRKEAKNYFSQVRKFAKRKHPAHKEARDFLKENKL
ncbi:tetratricopeptide repeat protein [Peijinzhouia sedimentorum]